VVREQTRKTAGESAFTAHGLASSRLPPRDELVAVLAIEQDATQLAAVGQGDTDAAQRPVGHQLAQRPRAEAEVDRRGRQIQQAPLVRTG
jgi:hypothetical protein